MTRQFIPYFRHPRVDITLVAGGSFDRLEPRHPREVLVVRDAWYPETPGRDTRWYRRRQEPRFDQLYFLSNTEELHRLRRASGFNSHFVNVGCFVDEDVFVPGDAPKLYDAVMNARFKLESPGAVCRRTLARAGRATGLRPRARALGKLPLCFGKYRELKRHWLAMDIERLALLDPIYESDAHAYKARYRHRATWCNDVRLEPAEVARVVSRAHCGLALSALEGVCRASCEYLLCGIPVVSTPSVGGRDVWYDAYNSIIAEPTEASVAAAVRELVRAPRDPVRIRRDFLARAAMFRRRFATDVLRPILRRAGVDTPPDEVMRTSPFRWWL